MTDRHLETAAAIIRRIDAIRDDRRSIRSHLKSNPDPAWWDSLSQEQAQQDRLEQLVVDLFGAVRNGGQHKRAERFLVKAEIKAGRMIEEPTPTKESKTESERVAWPLVASNGVAETSTGAIA